MLTGMSSESDGSHSGPYGATWITSFSWFSGRSESSKKCMSFSSWNGLAASGAACILVAAAGRGFADWDFRISFWEIAFPAAMPYLLTSQVLTGYSTLARAFGLAPELLAGARRPDPVPPAHPAAPVFAES